MLFGVSRGAAAAASAAQRPASRVAPLPAATAVAPLPASAARRLRVGVCARAADIEFVGGISPDEAAKFDRIAASLVAKLSNVEDYDIDEDGEGEGDEQLLPFGATPAQAAARQAAIAARRRSSAGGAGASSSAGDSGGLTLAEGPGGYVPRSSRRRKQIPNDALPKVAIVGRPNVGKSALFNRIAGSAVAVVFDSPGVTRDRLYARAHWGDKEFLLIDTGGLMSDAARLPPDVRAAAVKSISAEGLPQAIERQAAAGVAEADVVVLLADGQAGLQPGDEEILAWLRANHPTKTTLLAVNKCENSAKADLMVSDFWALGLTPQPVSAITGTGTGELLDALALALPPPASRGEEDDAEARGLAVAIVGRPNVGKSSLLNAIAGEERSIVCDMSGTTRDAVDTRITLPGGQRLTLIDTAGIRKRSRVADSPDGAESISVDRAMRAVRRADVAVLVVDAEEGVTQQDFRLSELFASEGKAVVVVVNKWDRVDPRLWTVEKMAENVRTQLRHVSWASVVCTCALHGTHVSDVLEAVLEAGAQHGRRVPTATLNMVLREATAWKAPPSQRGSLRKGRIYYATQAGVRPPSFVLFVNDEDLFTDDYRRYVERQLRDNIGFPGAPMRLFWRGKPKRERERPKPAAVPGRGGGRRAQQQQQQQQQRGGRGR